MLLSQALCIPKTDDKSNLGEDVFQLLLCGLIWNVSHCHKKKTRVFFFCSICLDAHQFLFYPFYLLHHLTLLLPSGAKLSNVNLEGAFDMHAVLSQLIMCIYVNMYGNNMNSNNNVEV